MAIGIGIGIANRQEVVHKGITTVGTIAIILPALAAPVLAADGHLGYGTAALALPALAAPVVSASGTLGLGTAAFALPALADPVVAAVAAPFAPWDLSGIACAVESDSVVLNGADVSQVNDKSGLARHPVQANAAKQPLWVAAGGPNNAPYIEGDGVDELLQVAFTVPQPMHRFCVLLPSVAFVAYDQAIDGGAGAVYNTCALYYHPLGAKIVALNQATPGNPGTNMSLETACVLTSWQRINTIWNGASSALQVNDAAPVTGTLNGNDVDGLCIGGRADESAWYYGDPQVCAVYMYSSVQAGNAKTLINWYINQKYGL